ncbi:hypothetical protein ABPG74_013021 [Tetrahymena malaccensis]
MIKNCQDYFTSESNISTASTSDVNQQPNQVVKNQLQPEEAYDEKTVECTDYYDKDLWHLDTLFKEDFEEKQENQFQNQQQDQNIEPNFGTNFIYMSEDQIQPEQGYIQPEQDQIQPEQDQNLNEQIDQHSSSINNVEYGGQIEDSNTQYELSDNQSISNQRNYQEESEKETTTATTASRDSNSQKKRKANADAIIEEVRQKFNLNIKFELLRKLKNNVKKNIIRTVLQRCNKNINDKQLQYYLNGLIFDQQIFNIYSRINNIYDQLYPNNKYEKRSVLIAFVQLYNENRFNYKYKNVRYLFQEFQQEQIEEKYCVEELEIVKTKLKNKCVLEILEIINQSKQIFQQFFGQFVDCQLIPYLYNDYKIKTYPNKNYNDYQFRSVDIQFAFYFIQKLFINNI